LEDLNELARVNVLILFLFEFTPCPSWCEGRRRRDNELFNCGISEEITESVKACKEEGRAGDGTSQTTLRRYKLREIRTSKREIIFNE
jgi:hypothetical protein